MLVESALYARLEADLFELLVFVSCLVLLLVCVHLWLPEAFALFMVLAEEN